MGSPRAAPQEQEAEDLKVEGRFSTARDGADYRRKVWMKVAKQGALSAWFSGVSQV